MEFRILKIGDASDWWALYVKNDDSKYVLRGVGTKGDILDLLADMLDAIRRGDKA